MICTSYHSTEISNKETEMFSQKHIFYTIVGGTFSLDISIYLLRIRVRAFAFHCQMDDQMRGLMLSGAQNLYDKKVGKDQEKAQSEKDSHSKNRGGKKLN